MVFLGIVMMPFYYGSKVRSVPEYLRLRYDRKAHLINAITFVVGSMLVAGVNLFALATCIEALLGIPLSIAIVVSAAFVLSYILLGGLTSAIYTEVIQFFVILAGLIPLLIVDHQGRRRAGLAVRTSCAPPGRLVRVRLGGHRLRRVRTRSVTGSASSSGSASALSFGYWTTNFAEVQRAMSAKDQHAARLTPIIGAYPKLFVPLVIILPGMAAVMLHPGIWASRAGSRTTRRCRP